MTVMTPISDVVLVFINRASRFMLSERWDVMATVDHMSNADLCDANRGLTNVGIRIGRRW